MVESMTCMMSGAVINIILDPVMIFGLGPFPKMGIEGAALATGIGQAAAALLYLILYIANPLPVKYRKNYLKVDLRLWKKLYVYRNSGKSEPGTSVTVDLCIECNTYRLWGSLCIRSRSLL